MLTDLLDLLTPGQMFNMLNEFAAGGTEVSRAAVKGWMLNHGFRRSQLWE